MKGISNANSGVAKAISQQEVDDIISDVFYPALPAPENVAVSGNVVSYDAVMGAEEYIIYANGDEMGRTLNTSIDLTTLRDWNDLPNGTYDVTVGATADGYTRIIQSQAVSVVKQENFLTFSSPESFTLSVNNSTKSWDGILETSTDKTTWTTWDGTSAVSSVSDGTKDNIYVRGIGNTLITGNSASSSTCPWRLNGTNISIKGNIENLLDYGSVALGQHPVMADAAFKTLFAYPNVVNTNITDISGLVLGADTLTTNCYRAMFQYNGGFKTISSGLLPATTLANSCYFNLFNQCQGLESVPVDLLPIMQLAPSCYRQMFQNCRFLTNVPELPATTLTDSCYTLMFYGCTSLIQTPELLATTMVYNCYSGMFGGCTSLTTAPVLPATTLASSCYDTMFSGCTSLTTAPELPATTLADGCYFGMFTSCTSLIQAPELPATTLANNCYYLMFAYCTSLYVSDTQTAEAQYEWRIPANGVITGATYSQSNMFNNCLGTRASNDFAGEVGQQYIYYTQNPPVGSN